MEDLSRTVRRRRTTGPAGATARFAVRRRTVKLRCSHGGNLLETLSVAPTLDLPKTPVNRKKKFLLDIESALCNDSPSTVAQKGLRVS
jgi:hypothetical protein